MKKKNKGVALNDAEEEYSAKTNPDGRTKTPVAAGEKRRKGISAQHVFITAVALVLVAFFMILFLASRIPLINQRVEKYNDQIRTYESNLSRIENCRNYFVRQARLFVENGDKVNADDYFAVYNEYDISLMVADIKNDNLGTDSQNSLFIIADCNLNMLQMEFYAMRLAVEANGADLSAFPQEISSLSIKAQDESIKGNSVELIRRARDYLYGKEYQDNHNLFEVRISALKQRLVTSIDAQLAKAGHKLYVATLYQNICVIAVTIIINVMAILFVRYFLWPLKKYEKCIECNTPFPVGGFSELRRLSIAYNKLYQLNMADREKLVERAERDALTGLMNQNAFSNIKAELTEYKGPMGLLVIDVDNFKGVNDEYGHDMGDRVLQRCASEISKFIVDRDRVIRLGGDEFVVIILGFTAGDEEKIANQVERLNKDLSEPFADFPALTVSVGLASSDCGYSEELFRRADQAMYSVKRNGGGGFHVYDGKENLRMAGDKVGAEGKRHTLLLVDDSDFNRGLLYEILCKRYDIVEVHNGFEAIDLIEKNGDEYDLVLLDLFMPECDGFQVLEYMKKYRWLGFLPVMVISAENDPAVITHAFEMGVMSYVSRPFSANTVLK